MKAAAFLYLCRTQFITMKKIISSALATLVALYAYSQDGTHLPLSGGTLTGDVFMQGAGLGMINLYRAYSGAPSNPGFEIKNHAGVLTFQHNSNGGVTNLGGLLTVNTNTPGYAAKYNINTNSIAYHAFQVNGVDKGYIQWNSDITANGAGTEMFINNIQGRLHLFDNSSSGLSVSGGKVGIGTVSPQYKLHVYGSGYNPNVLEIVSAFRKSSQGGGELALRVHDGLTNLLSTYEGLPNNMDMSFTTTQASGNQPENMRIQASTGNVGIGTSSPEYKLDVQSEEYRSLRLSANRPLIKFSSAAYNGGNGAEIWQNIDGGLYFNINGNKTVLYSNPDRNIGIGTYTPHNYKLAVAGNVIAESMKVALQGNWPDYVFKADNKLRSLPEVEQFVQQNHHLPEMPSEAEVKKEGIDLGQMDAKLLKKIEELTLYLIDLNKKMERMHQENTTLKEEVEKFREKIY
jgi:hypothetical protein